MTARRGSWGSAFVIALLTNQVGAQVITTIAGTSSIGPSDGTPALQAPVGPNLLTEDLGGNIYFLDQNTLIMKISGQQLVSRFAGNGIIGFSGDGGAAVNASLNRPEGVFCDKAGNLFITDARNFRIRKVDTNGIITTVVGNGKQGQSPDGTLAVNASIDIPIMVAVDAAGAIYFTETGTNRVKKVSPQGTLSTVAGTGQGGYSGDNGPATAARLNGPIGVAVDSSGGVIIADSSNYVIRRVDTSGTIRTIAGNGQYGFGGDGSGATSATLGRPWTVTVDAAGNILFVDYDNARIRRIDSRGVITTVAGNGQIGLGADNIPAVNSPLYYPFGVWPEPSGSFIIADFSNNVIRRVSSAGIITTIAGNGSKITTQRGGFAGSAIFDVAIRVALEPSGNLLVLDWINHYLDRINLSNGTISTVAGIGRATYNGDNMPAATAALNFPEGVTTDRAGNIYVADSYNHRIRKIDSNGVITTIAGAGTSGYSGDNGPATAALLSVPQGLRFDSAGNLVFADSNNNAVRMITPQGIIRTIAGAGPDKAGYNGDNIPATQARLNLPTDVAFDGNGLLYIADSQNHRVRRISNNVISTVAGTGVGGFSGDGPATSVELFLPSGLNFDSQGNLLIADQGNNRIRSMTSAGQMTTIVGDGQPRWAGDGGMATAASIQEPQGMVADAAGNIFIADSRNNRVREVLAAPPTFSVSGGPISFAGAAGGAPPSSQSISLSSTVPGLAYAISTDSPWLLVAPSGGASPASVQVTADPSALSPQSYAGTITITVPNANPPTRSIPVKFAVSPAQTGQLSLGRTSFSFSFTKGSGASTQQLVISNQGGGSIAFAATVATAIGGNWLSISANSGTVTPLSPASLGVTASPDALDVGTYSGTITIMSPNTGQQIVVQVTMVITSPPQKILLSQLGFTFTAVSGGGAVPTQRLGVLNTGAGQLDYSVRTVTTSGGSGWLTVSANSGTVTKPFLDVSYVDVGVSPGSLSAGTYYGQIQVASTGASNSPQSALVVLTVLPAGSNPGPDVRPGGLVFTSIAGQSSPSSQTVSVTNLTAAPITYGSSPTYVGAGGWVNYLPNTARVIPNSPQSIVVQPNFDALASGSYRSVLTLLFDDGSIEVVNILAVVAPAGSSLPRLERGERPFVAGCTPTMLLPQLVQLGFGSTTRVGFPAAVIAKIVDDCGSSITAGSVVVSFDNGDAPLSLTSLQDGTWTGTWQPVQPVARVTATLKVQSNGLTGQTKSAAVSLTAGQSVPIISAGPLGAATQTEGALAPGDILLIKGTGLANGQQSSTAALQQQLAGASLVIGGSLAPLLYADAGEIVALVPSDVPINSQPAFVISRDSSVGVPASMIIAAAHPAVLTKDGSGRGQALVYKSGALADSSNPVKAGDSIIIYCTGLGLTDSSGVASITPTVTIGGTNAQISYAGIGLTQDYPPSGPPSILGGLASTGLGGLYQIRATVPPNLNTGAAEVIVSAPGQNSPSGVTIAVSGITSANAPAITSVAMAGGSSGIIAQNGWIAIKGMNLAPSSVPATGLVWDSAPEFANGRMPTQLEGVSVTINEKSAFIFFVSPTQINALAPLDTTTGSVQVIVSVANAVSAPFTANLQSVSLAFPTLGATKYIAGVHTDGTYVGPTSLSVPGYSFSPAQPGETIVLFGFGFGLPSTTLVNGSATQSGPLPAKPTFLIGGVPADVSFAGVVSPGLYQFNLTVPNTTSTGDAEVLCSYGGQNGPAGDLIPIR